MTTSITLRNTKGSPLTYNEVDANFTNLAATADAATISVSSKAEAVALGVAADAADMGTFTGSTIPDNSDAKEAIQALETAVETKANASALGVAATAADMGTFTGSTIPDAQTGKQALQALETAVELRTTIASLADNAGADSGDSLVGSDDGSSGSLWTTVKGFISYLRSSVGSSIVGFIQSGTGAVARTAQDKMRDYTISPYDFGAVLDGIADDTAALQAYADHLATIADSTVTNGLTTYRRPVFWMPPGRGGVISAPLTIGKNISVICDAPIWISATASATPAGGAWVDIGRDAVNANRESRNCEFELDVRRQTLSDWASENDCGVRIDAAASRLWLKRIDKFALGAMVTAPYSVATLGEFRDCGLGLGVSWTALNFANQCQFIAGEFAVGSGVNNNLPRYGIRVTNGPATANLGNSITFQGPSFELNKTGAGVADCLPFVITNHWNVVAHEVRTENSGTVLARLTGDTRWFQADLIYNYAFAFPTATLLDDQSTYKIGNRAWLQGGDFDAYKANLIFDSGNLCDAATYYGFSTWGVKNMEVATNTDPGTFNLYGSPSSVDYKNRQVTLASAPLGVRVDTRNAKNFCVVVDGPTNKDTTIAILVFDANGNQLTANTDVLQNAATATVSSNTGTYGGIYNLSTIVDGVRREATIAFSANVATAFIGLSSGIIRGFKIYALDAPASYFSKATIIGKDQRLARAAPIAGAYTRGQQIMQTEAAASSAPGWVVTTSGQFGTLTGVTANTTSTSRSVVLNDVTNLWVGCAITIAGVTGTKIIEALEGTTAFVDSNCDATVSGGAVAYVAPVFKAMAVVAA